MSNEINVPDPWASKPELNIDDGGGTGFKSGYDVTNTLTLTGFRVNVPKTVGCWKINESFHVHVTKRPNRFNRVMTKFLLGWEWVDA